MDTRHEPWPARMEIRCTASIMLTDLQIYFASEYGFKPTQRWLPLPGGLAAPRADTRDRREGGSDFPRSRSSRDCAAPSKAPAPALIIFSVSRR